MTPSTLDSPIAETRGAPSADAIVEKLRSLRRRIMLWMAVDGIARLLLLVAVLIALDLALDWSFSMDRPQRLVVLGLMTGVIAWVAYRWLIRPLSRKLSDDTLCLLVERRYKQLGEGLISALQLSRQSELETGGASRTLMSATIEQGVASALPLSFHGVLRSRRFVVNVILSSLLIVLLGGVAVAIVRTNLMSIWFDRNVLLADRVWPQDFYLTFDGATAGELRVPRAEPCPLGISVRLARPDAKAPDEVTLELRSAGDTHTERMERGDGGSHFSGTLPAVDEAAEVRAVSPGGTTAWLHVRPIDRPSVTSLTISVTTPKYAGAVQETLEEGKGSYPVLPGSKVHVLATANKPLSQAMLTQGASTHTMKPDKDNAFSFDLDYQAAAAGVYSIALTDKELVPLDSQGTVGPLSSRVPTQFTLRTKSDRPPGVKLRLSGIGGMITARARLPLSAAIDDDFSITDAYIRYRFGATAGDASHGKDVRPEGLDKQLGTPVVRLEHVIDVEALKGAVGADLTLEVNAVDNNDVTGPGNGTSGKTVLRIVSDEEFRADLLRRETDQRLEVERLLKVQFGLIADTKELARPGTDDKPWSASAQQSATRVAREQKNVGMGLALVAKRVDELLTEAANNRLEKQSGPLQQRLRAGVHDRLMQIAEKSVPEVLVKLDDARRQASRPKERGEALAAAMAGQARIETELSDVLKHMVKSEDYQIILSLIMEIQHSQSDVHDRARRQLQEQLKGLFERNGTGAPGGKDPGEPGSR